MKEEADVLGTLFLTSDLFFLRVFRASVVLSSILP
jgi:hypothetical protein